jgi:hypothetical protein
MQAAKSLAARRSVTFTLRQERHIKEDEQVRRPVAPVLAVIALDLSGPRRDRLAHLADELDRARRFHHVINSDKVFGTHRVDLESLVGPPARIRERYRAWEDSGADSLSVRSRQPEAIEVMAKAARLN